MGGASALSSSCGRFTDPIHMFLLHLTNSLYNRRETMIVSLLGRATSTSL